MSSAATFIRNAESHLQDCRHQNLRHLNELYGHGFQSMLVQFMKHDGQFISASEVNNLVNATKNEDGSPRTVFRDSTARRIERALDLPMTCLDLPHWHFQDNLAFFWEYAARAADDRVWFDRLLTTLLDVPTHATPGNPVTPRIDLAAIRARLQRKQDAGADK